MVSRRKQSIFLWSVRKGISATLALTLLISQASTPLMLVSAATNNTGHPVVKYLGEEITEGMEIPESAWLSVSWRFDAYRGAIDGTFQTIKVPKFLKAEDGSFDITATGTDGTFDAGIVTVENGNITIHYDLPPVLPVPDFSDDPDEDLDEPLKGESDEDSDKTSDEESDKTSDEPSGKESDETNSDSETSSENESSDETNKNSETPSEDKSSEGHPENKTESQPENKPAEGGSANTDGGTSNTNDAGISYSVSQKILANLGLVSFAYGAEYGEPSGEPTPTGNDAPLPINDALLTIEFEIWCTLDLSAMPDPDEDGIRHITIMSGGKPVAIKVVEGGMTPMLMALMSNAPCNAPAYCINPTSGCRPENDPDKCICKPACECEPEDDPDECKCKPDCPCHIVEIRPCITPSACTNDDGCLCKGPAGKPDLCKCDDACLCRFPSFVVSTTTYVNGSTDSLTIPSGAVANVRVNVTSSGDATFKDVVIKTYIESPLEVVLPVDIFGVYWLKNRSGNPGNLDNPYKTTIDGKTYTVVEIESNISGASGGQIDFDVRFPPGVTASASSAAIFSIMEGNVICPVAGTLEFGQAQGEQMSEPPNTVALTAQARSDWDIEVINYRLDYKDPDITNKSIFRHQIQLNRDPAGNEGIYYLEKEGTKLVIELPKDSTFLRLTREDLNPIPHTTAQGIDGRQIIIISAEHIPFDSGFSAGTPSYSNACAATLYVVFEIDTADLPTPTPIGGIGSIEVYEGFEVKVTYDYKMATQPADTVTGAALVALVDYVPGYGGGGSIHKSAAPFIEGETFYKAGDAANPAATAVFFTINYENNSNTPVKGLTLADKLPTMLTLTGAGVTTANVSPEAIRFHQVRLTDFSAEHVAFADGNRAQAVVYAVFKDSTGNELGAYPLEMPPGENNTIHLDGWTSVPLETTEVLLEVRNADPSGDNIELRHGFTLRAQISVLGNPVMAEPVNSEERKRINFLRNTVTFSATSTKDTSTIVGGGSTVYVHIFPFENDVDPPKVWNLSGQVSSGGGSDSFAPNTTVSPGRDVYYRIQVTPRNAQQHVYSPVFYLELPPEIGFDGGTIGKGTVSGSNALSVSGSVPVQGLMWELIPNPVGPGEMLKFYYTDKQLLNPASSGYITVRATLKDIRVDPVNGALLGSAVRSRVYFGVLDPLTPLDRNYYSNLSPAALFIEPPATDGFGFGENPPTAPFLLLEDSVYVTVRGSGLLEGELWVQTEFDRGTNIWRRHPEVADALPGGLLTYRFNVRNDGSLAATGIVLYNVFSHEGDTLQIGGAQRNSKWSPYLVGPIDLGVWATHATIYYSEHVDHTVTTSGRYTGTDDWTTDPYNWQSVRAIKIVFAPDFALPGKESIEILAPMFAPVDYTFEEPDVPNPDRAVSSLAAQFQFVNNNGNPGPTSAVEPIKIAVRLIPNTEGEISGQVWGDLNDKGSKCLDECADSNCDGCDPMEFYEPDVRVELWRNGSEFRHVFTDVDGRYKFTNLEDDDYEVRVILPTGYGPGVLSGSGIRNTFTEHVPTATPPGFVRQEIKIYAAQDTSSSAITPRRIYTNVDAGIIPLPSSIRGSVWRNLDGTGVRNMTLDTNYVMPDFGLVGVTVRLYRMPGGGAAPTEIRTTTTAIDGTYTFEGLPAGRYFVEFGKLLNYSFADRIDLSKLVNPNNPADPDYSVDSRFYGKAGYSQALPSVPETNLALMLGQSYEIWLGSGKNVEGVDCGLVPAPGTISGTIWRDTNGNGVRDSGENGISNITVTLTKTGGYGASSAAIATTATGIDGRYFFTGLTPGTYMVTYTDANSVEWVSHQEYRKSAMDALETAIPESDRGHTATFAGIEIDPAVAGQLTHINYNLGLVQKVAITGRVFNDKNANDAWNPSPATNHDLPLTASGITITRTGGGDGTTFMRNDVNTDIDGEYTLTGLWPGTYTVEFPTGCVQGNDNDPAGSGTDYDKYLTMNPTATGATFYRAARTWTLTNIPSGYTRSGINLPLTRPRSIQGVVWHDRNGDAIINGAEEYLTRPLTLTLVEIAPGATAAPPMTPQLRTSTGGAFGATDAGYHFTNLYPGTYTVTVDRTGSPNYLITNVSGTALTAEGVYTILVPALDTGSANDPKDKDFGLAYPVTLSGHIWQDKWDEHGNGFVADSNYELNGTWDEGIDANLALPGVARLQRWSGTNWVNVGALANSDASGIYTFANQLPGTYRVVLSPNADTDTYFITGPDTRTADYYSNTTPVAAIYSFVDATNVATWGSTPASPGAITLYSNDSISGLNLSLGRYATISGTFWHDVDGDGMVSEPPDKRLTMANYPAKWRQTVTLLRHDGTTYAAIGTVTSSSAVSGGYEFNKVKPGEYQVVYNQGLWRVTNATPPALTVYNSYYYPANSRAIWAVDYTDANTWVYAGRDYLISEYSSISGNVWIDRNADGVINAGETASAGAILTLNYSSGPYRDWWDYDYTLFNNTTTMAIDGSYKFENLWPGTYTVTLENPDGYMRTNNSTNSAVTAHDATDEWIWEIKIDSMSDIKDVNFGLVKPSSLSGDIWHDVNADGVKNGSEIGIGNVTLTRTNVESGMRAVFGEYNYKTSTVDENTGFKFDNLLPGTYTLTSNLGADFLRTWFATTLSAPGGAGSSATITTTASIMAYVITITDGTGDGVAVTGAAAGYAKPSTIGGIVFNDIDNKDIRDGKDPIPGVTAHLRRLNDGGDYDAAFTQRNSAGDGTFDFTGLLPGRYEITFTSPSPGWLTTTPDKTVTGTSINTILPYAAFTRDIPAPRRWIVTIPNDGSEIIVNTGFLRQLSISGTVWKDNDANGVRDADEEYYPDQAVSLYQNWNSIADPGTLIATTTTTAIGAYSFTGLYPGNYTVVLTLPDNTWVVTNTGGNLRTNNRWRGVTLTTASATDIDFGLRQLISISGRVWIDKNADGVFNTGEMVSVGTMLALDYISGPHQDWWDDEYPTDKETTNTAIDGSYKFENLWPGTYTVRLVNSDDYMRTNNSTNSAVAAHATDERMWIITIVSMSDIEDVNFGLVKPSSLSGDIWHDINADGVKNGSEAGIGSVTLTRTNVINTAIGYTRTLPVSSTAGFTFNGLLPGTYTLTSDLEPDFLRTWFATTLSAPGVAGSSATIAATASTTGYSITITDGTGDGVAVTGAVAGYARQSHIKGIVFNDRNSNNIIDTGEGAISGVTTYLNRLIVPGDAPDPNFTQRTSLNGTFNFNGLLPGTYEITFDAPADRLVTTPNNTTATGTSTNATPPNAVFTRGAPTQTWRVTIPFDGSAIIVDTGLVQKSSISGIVWKDHDANGVRDADEEYYPDRTVRLYQNWNSITETGTLIATTTTTAIGAYSFTGLYPGNYTVVLTLPDDTWVVTNTGADLRSNNPLFDLRANNPWRSVTLADNTASEGHSFGLTQLISISGRVWRDTGTPPSGAYNPATVVAGARINIAGPNGFTAHTSTNAIGFYEFSDLLLGAYTVTFAGTGYEGWAVTNRFPHQGNDGTTTEAGLRYAYRAWDVRSSVHLDQQYCDFALAQFPVIRGKVWRDVNGNGTYDAEPRIENIDIRIYKVEGPNETLVSTPTGIKTDANGEYSFRAPEEGTYRVVVVTPAGWSVTNWNGNNHHEITIERSGTYTVDFGLSRLFTITGMIWWDDNGDGWFDSAANPPSPPNPPEMPITGAAIELWKQGSGGAPYSLLRTATTGDDDGYYTFASLLPGVYQVRLPNHPEYLITGFNGPPPPPLVNISSFDLRTGVWTLTIADRGNDPAETTIANVNSGYFRPLSIEGTLLRQQGVSNIPIVGQEIQLWRSVAGGAPVLSRSVVGGAPVLWRSTTTTFGGMYSFDMLLPGDYQVRIVIPAGTQHVAASDGVQQAAGNWVYIDSISLAAPTPGAIASPASFTTVVASAPASNNNSGNGGGGGNGGGISNEPALKPDDDNSNTVSPDGNRDDTNNTGAVDIITRKEDEIPPAGVAYCTPLDYNEIPQGYLQFERICHETGELYYILESMGPLANMQLIDRADRAGVAQTGQAGQGFLWLMMMFSGAVMFAAGRRGKGQEKQTQKK